MEEIRDFLENLEDAAEKNYQEGMQPDGKFKCCCDRIFDPDKEGGIISANPYAMPVCGECFSDWEKTYEGG